MRSGMSPATDAIAVSIRRFSRADEARVRRICFGTAFYGRPMTPVLNDVKWLSEGLLGYDLRFEPESLWVAWRVVERMPSQTANTTGP